MTADWHACEDDHCMHQSLKPNPQTPLHAPEPKAKTPNPKPSTVNSTQVNFIIRMHQSMLRDAAATDVYYTMLLAKQGWRSNFSGYEGGETRVCGFGGLGLRVEGFGA